MSKIEIRNWQAVQDEVLRRIHAREWKPGDMIPNEVDLADEFGCARATVNRALRAVADKGLLDRRRKAGTRVALRPVTKATLNISVIRQEIEARGQVYGYQLLSRNTGLGASAGAPVAWSGTEGSLLHIRALHLADATPYAIEDRWIDVDVVPGATKESFDRISPNEWLLMHAPYTHGDIAFSAGNAPPDDSKLLNIAAGQAVFVIDRATWDRDRAITNVRLTFAPGYRMQTDL